MELDEMLTTKEQLLSGEDYFEKVQTDMGTFKIRSLTEGEKTRAEAMVARGMVAKNSPINPSVFTMEGEGEKVMQNQSDCTHYIIACGLSVKPVKWTMDEVKKVTFKPGVVDILQKRIETLSGMGGLAAIKAESFRKDGGGNDSGESVKPTPRSVS